MRNRRRPLKNRHISLMGRWKPVIAMGSVAACMLWAADAGPGHLHAQQARAEYNAKKQAAQGVTRPIPGTNANQSAAQLAKIIDDEVALRLSQEKLPPSGKSDDSEFVRRVYLDLTGVIPPLEKLKAFLGSHDPNKREKLIDELLADPRFGKQQSEIWMHQLISPDLENRFLPTENMRKWLEEAFNHDKPWNKVVEELVTASGSMDNNPATMFFIANSGPDKVTSQVSKLFLGVQLQCAQCHNHPFTDWKQEEYWGMAAFFMKVKQNGTPKKAAKDGSPITVSETTPVSTVAKFGKAGKLAAKKKDKDKAPPPPEGVKYVPPKFLAGEQPKVNRNAPLRPVLAKWMTSGDNPFFARAMVNRTWAHFFGRGFVNPIDDMHDGNPATHPELLAALAEQFKRQGYDIKYLMKAITLSETYQRSSKPIKGNETDTEFFSRMYVRSLTAEQLVDSVMAATGGSAKLEKFAKKGAGGKKGKGLPVGPREQLVKFFNVEDGADPLEYQDGIPQALRLMNGPLFNNGGTTLTGALRQRTIDDALDYLFVSTLSRHPTVQENTRLLGYVTQEKDKRTAYGDILWTLLNCSEFRLNH